MYSTIKQRRSIYRAILPGTLAMLIVLLSGLFSPTILAVGGLDPKSELVLLGTSKEGGGYYPVGHGICNAVNKQILHSGTRCVALVSGGSVYNIYAVRNGGLALGLTRDDLLEDAYRRKGNFVNQNFDDLRIITPLYDNPLTIVVREDSDINTVDDLVGRRVNIGSKGSGRRAFSEFLFQLKKWKHTDFAEINEYSDSKIIATLCNKKTDATFQLIGYPSSFYTNLQQQCPLRILSLDNKIMDEIIKHKPLLSKNESSYTDYLGKMRLFRTVSTTAVLFGSAKTSPELISFVVARMVEDMDTNISGIDMRINIWDKINSKFRGSVPRHMGVTHFLKNQSSAHDSDKPDS